MSNLLYENLTTSDVKNNNNLPSKLCLFVTYHTKRFTWIDLLVFIFLKILLHEPNSQSLG